VVQDHCSTGQGKIASTLFSIALQNRLTAALCQFNNTYGGLPFIKLCSNARPMHCRTGQGKVASSLLSVALQNMLTACLCHCNYACGHLLFMQVCSDPPQMHCRYVQGKMQSPMSIAALQSRLTAGSVSMQLQLWRLDLHTGVQRPTANALQLCSRPKSSPHCSLLLCKTGQQQAVCHCSYTYGVLLFIQVCSNPAQMHCSTVQGKMQSPLFIAALQTRMTAGSVSLHLRLWTFALHAGVQQPSTNALQPCSGHNAIATVKCCSAKQANSRQCVTAGTPMEICSSCRCAVTQHKCTAGVFRAKCNSQCPLLLCKAG